MLHRTMLKTAPLATLLLSTATFAQAEAVTRAPRAILQPSTSAAGGRFGASAAMDSGFAVFGAPGANSAGLFERGSSNSWEEVGAVTAGDLAAGDDFGWAVAFDGDLVVIAAPNGSGANGADQGAVYVFEESGNDFVQVAKLTAADGANGDGFGSSVAIDGDRIVVGAPLADLDGAANRGAVYVFDDVGGGNWMQSARITAADGAAEDRFGASVATHGSRVLAGAPARSATGGAAYIFRLSGGAWLASTTLVSNEGGAGMFGAAVALSSDWTGDYAFVGGPSLKNGTATTGAAFAYRAESDTVWTQEARLVSADKAAGDSFGASIAAYDDRVAVGAPGDTVRGTNRAGSATVFRRSGDGLWQASAKLAAASGIASSSFGASVALHGERVMVGAPQTSGGGLAYHFKIDCAKPSVDDNGRDDLFWFNPTAGKVSYWTMDGLARQGAGTVAKSLGQSVKYHGVADFYGNGKSAVLLRNKSNGSFRIWRLSGSQLLLDKNISAAVGPGWNYLATGDISGDGKADILLRQPATGAVKGWLMSGASRASIGDVGNSLGLTFVACIDVNADARADILWRDAAGTVRAWIMNGLVVASETTIGGVSPLTPNWVAVGAGDLDGDGDDDLLWRDRVANILAGWILQDATVVAVDTVAAIPAGLRVECTADLDGDGDEDIVWRNKLTGGVEGSLMTGLVEDSRGSIGSRPTSWSCMNDDDGNDDDGGDGRGDDDNDDDDDNGGDETVGGSDFAASLDAALAASALPILEAEAELEGGTTFVEVVQWNAGAGQLVRVLVLASTGTVASTVAWTPSAGELSDYAEAIAAIPQVAVPASAALNAALAARPGTRPHSIELENEDGFADGGGDDGDDDDNGGIVGPVWKIELVNPNGSTFEYAVPAM